MRRRLETIALLIFLLFLGLTSTSFAWHGGKEVTPYGDFCPMASRYGMKGERLMSLEEAKKALFHYYHPRGYNFWIVEKKNRFLKINIIKGHRVVDTIIFDRKTGRVRSIF
ncbi:MAG: hypothetical protein D6726_04180 [Nitrospirae bacterium]|nr:MAG: hypothetical protein D6726_04180 [Nitrospirota bacterium]